VGINAHSARSLQDAPHMYKQACVNFMYTQATSVCNSKERAQSSHGKFTQQPTSVANARSVRVGATAVAVPATVFVTGSTSPVAFQSGRCTQPLNKCCWLGCYKGSGPWWQKTTQPSTKCNWCFSQMAPSQQTQCPFSCFHR